MNLNSENDGTPPFPAGSPPPGLFTQNLRVLCERFPGLADMLSLHNGMQAGAEPAAIPSRYRLEYTRNGQPLISVDGFFLQSRYNPRREASRTLDDPAAGFSPEGCVFAGLGSGYFCLEYAARFPQAVIVILEPDVHVFLLCMQAQDLRPVFERKNTVLLVGMRARDCALTVEKLREAGACLPVFRPPALGKISADWFAEFAETVRRTQEKRNINRNTLKRFGGLWLRNMAKNLGEMQTRCGITPFAGVFAGFPVLLLAAGPSLDSVLPLLPALRETCVVVAVDTALRACLRAGVQPDFLVLVDPQYWNYRHIAGLSAGRTFFITESAAWPAVFRFPCRDIFLCASLFPMGRFLEGGGDRGTLGAGGSVATTAWDFARYLGGNPVYAAGLDLGYPDGKTHFHGALFEEKAHTESGRLRTAETAAAGILASGGAFRAEDASGKTILTDRRLSLYSWWFETAAAAHPETQTRRLSDSGLRIPGISAADPEEAAALPPRRKDIDRILERIRTETAGGQDESAQRAFLAAEQNLLRGLEEVRTLAENASRLCTKALRSAESGRDGGGAQALSALDEAAAALDRHPVKDVLAMTFTESGETFAGNPEKNAAGSFFANAGRFYDKIAESAAVNLRALKKNAASLKNP